MGVYGPHTQVKRLFKALIFLTCKQNIIIFPDEISAVSVTPFDSYRPSKWQKVHKFGLCGQYRLYGDLKIIVRLKIFHILRVHVEVISTTVTDLSDLPLLTYRGKYGKNVEKMSKYGLYGPQKQF